MRITEAAVPGPARSTNLRHAGAAPVACAFRLRDHRQGYALARYLPVTAKRVASFATATLQRAVSRRKKLLECHLWAAEIFFDSRRRGLTIRNSIDCLIAQIAIEHGVPLLQNDRDFAAIARVRRLRKDGRYACGRLGRGNPLTRNRRSRR